MEWISVNLELAAACARLRLSTALGMRPNIDDRVAWSVRSHPWIVENDRIRNLMTNLGYAYQNDCNLDLRQSAYWPLFEHRTAYEDAFEEGRRVQLDQLTPRNIYEGLLRRNHLTWLGWCIAPGVATEETDEYGLPCLQSPVHIDHETGKSFLLTGVSKETAKHTYALITGKPYEGVDELGDDSLHFSERH